MFHLKTILFHTKTACFPTKTAFFHKKTCFPYRLAGKSLQGLALNRNPPTIARNELSHRMSLQKCFGPYNRSRTTCEKCKKTASLQFNSPIQSHRKQNKNAANWAPPKNNSAHQFPHTIATETDSTKHHNNRTHNTFRSHLPSSIPPYNRTENKTKTQHIEHRRKTTPHISSPIQSQRNHRMDPKKDPICHRWCFCRPFSPLNSSEKFALNAQIYVL